MNKWDLDKQVHGRGRRETPMAGVAWKVSADMEHAEARWRGRIGGMKREGVCVGGVFEDYHTQWDIGETAAKMTAI